MFKIPSKEPLPFYNRGAEYHYKFLKLDYRDYDFYKDVSNLKVSTDMLQYARDVKHFDYRDGHYLYAIKVCSQNKKRQISINYSDVHIGDLCVPIGLFRHLGRSLYPEAFGQKGKTRKSAKAPSIFKKSKSFILGEWERYMSLITLLAKDDFELIFVGRHCEKKPSDQDRIFKHLEKGKSQTQHYEYAKKALAHVATQDGMLNNLTKRTKHMIEESLPTLQSLDGILKAILKLEEEDIEARSQAVVNAAIEQQRQDYEAKLEKSEERHTRKLLEMHETIAKLQDMVQASYEQNELLLKAQEAQAGKYEGNLMALLGRLKDEL